MKKIYLGRKSTILILRWLVVLLVIFLTGYSPAGIDFGDKNYLLVTFFFLSNLGLTFLPKRYFDKSWLTYTIFLLDVGFVSTAIYFSGGIDSDFYLIYFLCIFISTIGQNLKGTIPVAFVASLLYGWLVYHNQGTINFSSPFFWIRIPFFFLIALFSSFWAEQAIAERRKKEEAERFGQELQREVELATEEIRRTSEKLKSLKEYNENILASITSGVIVVDLEDKVTTFNHEASKILRLPSVAVIDRKLSEFEELKPIDNLLRQTRETGRPIFKGEISLKNKHTERGIDLGISTSILRTQTTRTNGAIAIFRDLSEIRELEERMRRSEQLVMLGSMAAAVAHEIRNPLNSIAGFAQLLQTKIASTNPHRRYADIIVQESFRIDILITDILDFVRQRKLQLVPLKIEQLIETVISSRKEVAEKKGISLRQNFTSPLPSILGDSVRLERVFLNLVNNALEATQENGGVVVSAGLVQKDGEDEIEISVQDDGCGIPQKNLKQIFTPFFTTKERGTGLGLSIVQKIVEDHGGTVSVESEEGKGATFFVYLPVKE
ncbi:MAG: ATP-binding protein [Candidatus Edwardsbacteria bacterium]